MRVAPTAACAHGAFSVEPRPIGWECSDWGVGSGVLANDPIAPLWLVAPLAIAAEVCIAAYAMALSEAHRQGLVPDSRARIRAVSVGLALVGVPLLGMGFGVVPPSESRQFLLTWMTASGFLMLVLLTAVLDMANTMRLAAVHRAELRTEARKLGRAIVQLHAERAAASAAASAVSTPPSLRLARDAADRNDDIHAERSDTDNN